MIARDIVWPTMSQRSPSKGGLGKEIWQAHIQYLKESMSEIETEKTARDRELDKRSKDVKKDNRKREERDETKEITQPKRDREP